MKRPLAAILLFAILFLAACNGEGEKPAPTAPPTSPLSATITRPSSTATPIPTARPTRSSSPTASRPLPTATSPATTAPRTVMVHLFEWTWPDVAQECERFLGPAGYVAVQVSPPQEHLVVEPHPWWQRYQPVSYHLESRSGTRTQFAEMVGRCRAAGVDVYVDAVINHMTGVESGIGSAGTHFTHYDYPGLYGPDDFHHCGLAPDDDIANYQDAAQVRRCELLNLADLDTGKPEVQAKIAAYLDDLVDLGVAGLRLDAAKHMAPEDIAAILARVSDSPYIYQEVIDQGGEPITARQYLQNGDVTEFKYGLNLGRVFQEGRLAELEHFGEAWGFLPSTEAVVFVDNHDNQRGHGGAGTILTHRQPELYELASIFMLGWPYGYPRVMSSYPFDNPDQGPPSAANGETDPVYDGPADGAGPDCFGEWVCEHRWPAIANMVAFHNQTASDFYVSNWWSNGNDQIAFGRGPAGFVVINREQTELSRTFQTGLAPGRYCDVVGAAVALIGETPCPPHSVVTVDGNGRFQTTIPPLSALALHTGATLP